MLKRFIGCLLVLAICLIPFSAIPFDQTPGKFKEFENWSSTQKVALLSNGWVTVRAMGAAEGLYADDEDYKVFFRRGTGFFSNEGSGYHLGNGVIMTAAHVVIPTQVEIKINSSFSWVVPIDKLGKVLYSVSGVPATLLWADTQLDLALLKVELKLAPSLKDYGYKTTWTYCTPSESLIKEGDSVAIIVSARDEQGDKLWHHVTKYGKITCPKELMSYIPIRSFLIEIEVIPGDSGSPVFAFDKGVPVIVGVIQAFVVYQGHLYAVAGRIDPIHRIMLERK